MISKISIALFVVLLVAGGIAGLAVAQDEVPEDGWTGPEVREGYLWAPDCDPNATEPNVAVQEIANTFGVPYSEVLGWYCQGWPLWEVTLAYTVNMETGVAVADLFAMRERGMTWHEILQAIGYEIEDPYGQPNPLPVLVEKLCQGVTEREVYTLAKEHGLPVDDILAMICGNIEFGETEGWYSITGIKFDGEKMKELFAEIEFFKGTGMEDGVPSQDEIKNKVEEELKKVDWSNIPWKDKLPWGKP